jgi:hypothetical protein
MAAICKAKWAIRDSNASENPEENVSNVRRDALSDAPSLNPTTVPPDLAMVLAAWPKLAEATRGAILTIIRAKVGQ